MWAVSAKKVMLAVAKQRRWAEIIANGSLNSQTTTPADRAANKMSMETGGDQQRSPATEASRETTEDFAQWSMNGVARDPPSIPSEFSVEGSIPNILDESWGLGNDMLAGLDNDFWFDDLQTWTTSGQPTHR